MLWRNQLLSALGAKFRVEEVVVSEAYSFGEFGGVMPSEAFGLGYVEQLARCAVGLGCVPEYLSLESYGIGHHFGELTDGEFFSCTAVDGFVARIVIHQVDAEVGHVVHIEELAEGRAVAPAGYRLGAAHFCLVEAADEGRQHMAVRGVIVVVGAVEIGRHHRYEVGAVLAVEVFAVFEARNFCKGVCFVGLFERGSEQAVLAHGLRGQAGIDARRTKEEELAAAILPGGVDHVHLKHHVDIHEVGRSLGVGHDASHLCGAEENVVGTFGGEEVTDSLLICEVELRVGACDDIVVALTAQFAHDGRANHAAVSGHIYLGVGFHSLKMKG